MSSMRWGILCACFFCAIPARAEVIDIDNAELSRLLARGIPLIDIRTEGEWRSSGVIAGSRLLTFFDAAGNANPPEWLERAKAVAGPQQPVILVCRSGNRTQAVARFLSAQAGYRTVYNLSRGVNAWVGERRTLVPPTSSMAVCASGVPC